MGKTLYFDCFSGVSGDMVLGALLDLGLPLAELRQALGSLALDVGAISADRVLRSGVSATKFRVREDRGDPVQAGGGGAEAGTTRDHPHDHQAHHHDHDDAHDHRHEHHPGDEPSGHRTHGHAPHGHGQAHGGAAHGHGHPGGHGHYSLAQIRAGIGRSGLSPEGKERAAALFQRLAEAEASIHEMPVDRIHLHEVGAVDSIIDIVGAVFGLDWVGASRIVSSPLNVGGGTVRCAHGVFPVPAPATARLLRGAPVYAGAVQQELTTPTGALIVTGYAEAYGPLPPMRLVSIGYGAGDRDVPRHPNVLRVFVGEEAADAGAERIVTIECEIDDMNPQLFGPLMDRLYEAGALDVYYAAVQMKKNRPGTLVTVLAPPERRDALAGVLFAETTTIGVRFADVQRERLARASTEVETPVGTVRLKVARRHGRIVNASPEFDDCARLAAERGLPVKDVQALAMKAWLERGDR